MIGDEFGSDFELIFNCKEVHIKYACNSYLSLIHIGHLCFAWSRIFESGAILAPLVALYLPTALHTAGHSA